MIKGGCKEGTVYHHVQMQMKEGKTFSEAIETVEGILRAKFDEELKARIRTEINFYQEVSCKDQFGLGLGIKTAIK